MQLVFGRVASLYCIVTDHYPLVPILNSHRLDEIENPRLQRLKTRVMAYNFTAEWVKWSLNNAPDALSRNPVSDPEPTDMLAERSEDGEEELSVAEIRAVSGGQQKVPACRFWVNVLKKMRSTSSFSTMFETASLTIAICCQRVSGVFVDTSVDDGLIVYGCRLVIPAKMRHEILSKLHESHQGSVRTKQRARLSVYWLGIDNCIDSVILSCKHCQERLPSHPKEPLVVKPRPFQEIAMDFCSYGGHGFLILVDCCTDWPEIFHMGRDTTVPQLLTALRQAFCRSGAPDIVWSDQGPQFTSRLFREFAAEWGFQHIMSSPRYPRATARLKQL